MKSFGVIILTVLGLAVSEGADWEVTLLSTTLARSADSKRSFRNKTIGSIDLYPTDESFLLQNNLVALLELRSEKSKLQKDGSVLPMVRRHDIGWSLRQMHEIQESESLSLENSVTEMLCIQKMSKDIGSSAFVSVQNMMRTKFIGGAGSMILGSVLEPIVYVVSYILAIIIIILCIAAGLLVSFLRAETFILPPCLDMLLGPMVADGLSQRLSRVLTYTLGDAVAELMVTRVLSTLNAAIESFMGMVSGPQLSHRVVRVTGPHIAKETLRMLKAMVVQGVTHTVIHDVTHKVIQTYYCDYCHW